MVGLQTFGNIRKKNVIDFFQNNLNLSANAQRVIMEFTIYPTVIYRSRAARYKDRKRISTQMPME